MVDVVGPEGHSRHWLGLQNNRLAILERSALEARRCPRLVVDREHLFEVSRHPWRFLANPALLRLELPGFTASGSTRPTPVPDEPTPDDQPT